MEITTDIFSPTRTIFRTLLLISLGILLLSLGPQKGRQYDNAIKELELIQQISPRYDDIYAFIEPLANEATSQNPRKALAALFEKKGINCSKCVDEFQFYGITEGFLFPETIGDLLRFLEKDLPFVIQGPRLGDLITQLEITLDGRAHEKPYRLSMSCNYAMGCRVDMDYPSGAIEEFFIDVQPELRLSQLGRWSYLRRQVPDLQLVKPLFPNLRKHVYEVYDLNIDKAFRELTIQKSKAEGKLSLFGFQVQEGLVLIVGPLGLLFTMLLLLSGLKQIEVEPELKVRDLHQSGLVLFHENLIGKTLTTTVVVITPVLSVLVLVFKQWNMNLFSVWFASVMTVPILWIAMTLHRQIRKMMSDSPWTPVPEKGKRGNEGRVGC